MVYSYLVENGITDSRYSGQTKIINNDLQNTTQIRFQQKLDDK